MRNSWLKSYGAATEISHVPGQHASAAGGYGSGPLRVTPYPDGARQHAPAPEDRPHGAAAAAAAAATDAAHAAMTDQMLALAERPFQAEASAAVGAVLLCRWQLASADKLQPAVAVIWLGCLPCVTDQTVGSAAVAAALYQLLSAAAAAATAVEQPACPAQLAAALASAAGAAAALTALGQCAAASMRV